VKEFYFLSGLPRTGNTLLSAILNQNPNVYSSNLSPVVEHIWDAQKVLTTTENGFLSSDLSSSYSNNILPSFYKTIEKPIVIDRSKVWGVPDYFEMLRSVVVKDPKIIFTHRPVVEILASYISILPEDSFIDKEMQDSGWWYKDYLSKDDNRCDYLMRPYGEIDRILLSFNTIKKYPNNFCLIEYNALVSQPEQSLKKIYDFLGIAEFKHDFLNVTKKDNEVDLDFKLKKPLHEVRKSVSRTSVPLKDVLSDYVINKYSQKI
jgi:sulfotransferase